ncbi:MAG: capsular biosynthesis protein, partial [Chitinophagaceae bacterium]|nr:capsular biosynthesis protein [Chitinophagaceae bacterium]
MVLISSGAYVEPSLKSEFGLIPPSFLPVRNKRLFVLQKESLHFEEQVYISLPKSFNINIADEKLLIENNVKIIQVPDNLSIGLSIFYSLNKIKERDEPIRILYGDTLIANLPLFNNFYALG